MPFFSQDFLESLSDKADIVDVISDYVTLKNSGFALFTGKRPLPSMWTRTSSFFIALAARQAGTYIHS